MPGELQQSQLRPAALRRWPLLQQLGHTWSQDRDSSELTLPHCQDNIKLNLK